MVARDVAAAVFIALGMGAASIGIAWIHPAAGLVALGVQLLAVGIALGWGDTETVQEEGTGQLEVSVGQLERAVEGRVEGEGESAGAQQPVMTPPKPPLPPIPVMATIPLGNYVGVRGRKAKEGKGGGTEQETVP